ncbi:helix-turn-helix transcriptional regulator [Pengzhenrongella sp.]|jgi:transcriptional regulator with XRE-family HTH domain|uniref:helix-turn-helix transcriptional regulator n=1 Tax=Pengzhenrongella sp. TaxID=2888820 RepID=UPI002F92BBF2
MREFEREARTPQRIGLVIRDARRDQGLTQAQLAKKAHVSRAWLISLETGNNERAELGLVLSTVRALDLTVHLAPAEPATAAEADALDFISKL